MVDRAVQSLNFRGSNSSAASSEAARPWRCRFGCVALQDRDAPREGRDLGWRDLIHYLNYEFEFARDEFIDKLSFIVDKGIQSGRLLPYVAPHCAEM